VRVLPRVVRLVAALAWLRWRALVNALAGRRRGSGGRVAAWLGLVATVVLGLLATGIATALAVGAWLVGRALAAGDGAGPALVGLRVAGAFFIVLLALFTVLAAGRSAIGDWTRLLLLPIGRRELHAVELIGGLGEPWLLVTVPSLLLLASALAARGGAAMLLAGLGGALLYLTLGALATLLVLLVQLLLRDRRRAEVVMLVAMMAMMTLGWLPGAFLQRGHERKAERRSEEKARQSAPRERGAPRPATAAREASERAAPAPAATEPRAVAREPAGRRAAASDPAAQRRSTRLQRWLQPLPSEAYAQVLAHAAGGRPGRAAIPLAILAAEATLLYALSALAWRRLVDSPAVGSRRSRTLALPRLASPSSLAGHPATAIARVQVAITLRSVQGRIAVVSPTVVAAAFSLTADFGRAFGGFTSLLGGTAVLALGPLSVMVYQAVLLNQFGIDGPGFSLQTLSPLSDRDLVRGRAVAGAALALLALLPALVVTTLLHPATPWLLLPAAVLGGAAAYLLVAPAALWISMLFPKAADLSKLGNQGKPHGAAVLAGLFLVTTTLGCVQALGALGYLIGGAAGVLLAETLLATAAALLAWPLLHLVARSLPARRDALLLALRAN
jgi:hypothetical protein